MREALPIEVRDQRRDRLAIGARGDAAHRPRRGVLVFVGARVEIEIDAAHQVAGHGVLHIEIDRVLVPRGHDRLFESHAVEALGDLEHPVQRRHGRKVAAERLLIDGVALLAQPLAEVHDVPTFDRRSLELRQRGQVVNLALGDHALHLVQKARHRIGILDHAALRDVVRVTRDVVEVRDLFAQRDDLVEDLQIARRAAVRVRDVVAPARLAVRRIHHERQVVGIVEADHDVALPVARHTLHVRLRQPRAFVRREVQHGLVLANVLPELLRQLGEALRDFLEALPLLRRQRHAAVLERLE